MTEIFGERETENQTSNDIPFAVQHDWSMNRRQRCCGKVDVENSWWWRMIRICWRSVSKDRSMILSIDRGAGCIDEEKACRRWICEWMLLLQCRQQECKMPRRRWQWILWSRSVDCEVGMGHWQIARWQTDWSQLDISRFLWNSAWGVSAALKWMVEGKANCLDEKTNAIHGQWPIMNAGGIKINRDRGYFRWFPLSTICRSSLCYSIAFLIQNDVSNLMLPSS